MKAVIQRVAWAKVSAGGESSAIGRGFLVLVGVEAGDTEAQARWAAAKIAGLRAFEDGDGKMNLGLQEVGGEVLAVSQFTLAGSIAKGRRPSFDGAMAPGPAKDLYLRFVDLLRAEGVAVKTGFFQEHMAVELLNDGPVTFILEKRSDG